MQHYHFAGVLEGCGRHYASFRCLEGQRVWRGSVASSASICTGEARLSCKVCQQGEGCYHFHGGKYREEC